MVSVVIGMNYGAESVLAKLFFLLPRETARLRDNIRNRPLI